MAESITFEDIEAAALRIQGGVVVTPCNLSTALSQLAGCSVYAKAEYLQHTGSFKERGARNALLLLSSDERRKGVVAASAGNHALALAYHGKELGIPVTVVMPLFAPLIKQTRCAQLGAQVLIAGQNIAESKTLADRLVEEQGLTYVHGFDGAAVMAGAGTLGLEIVAQVPNVDVIVVPVGGAGLIAGLGLAVKTVNPKIRVIGVETANTASLSAALAAGEPVEARLQSTLADGLAVPKVGPHAFEIARKVVDEVVKVDEEAVAVAILRLVELEKGVVEGAGAASLAALLSGVVPGVAGKNVAICLCGGNIDPMVLSRVIEHALVADGRLAQFRAVISDRPGGLAKICELIASVGASVKQILHERAFAGVDVSTVEVECTVETRGREHIAELLSCLRQNGIRCAESRRSDE